MDIKTLEVLSIVLYCAAGVFFAAAVVLFFVFRVPALLGFITGRTAKRSVAEMKAKKNERAQSGAITAAMSGSVEKTTEMAAAQSINKTEAAPVPAGSAATTVLENGADGATTVIDTAKLMPAEETSPGTTVISKESEEEKIDFRIIQEFSYTSSNEIIE